MSIRRSLAFSFLEKYASTAINVASTLALARLLTPEEIGVFSVGAAVVGIVHALRDFGVTNYLIQEREVDRQKLRTAFTVTLGLSWLFAAVLLLMSGIAADFYREDGLREVIWVMAANFVLIPFGSPILALMRREMQFGRLAAIHVAATAVNAATGITLAATGFGFMSLAWASLAGVATTSGLAFLSRPHAFLLRPGLHEWRSVLSFGGYASANALIGDFRQVGPDLIIGRMLGFEAVGLHSRARGLLSIFSRLITQALQPVLLPALAQKVRRGEDLRETYLKAMEYVTVLYWPFLAFLGLMSDPIVYILLGPQWDAVAPLVSILCGSYALAFPSFLTQPLLISLGRIRDTLTLNLIMLPVGLFFLTVGALHSLTMVVILSYPTAFLGTVVTLTLVRRQVRFSLPELARRTGRSALVTLAAAAVPVAVLAWANGDEVPLPLFLLAAVAFCLLWGAALLLLRHPFADELRHTLALVAGKLRAGRFSRR